MNLDTMKTSGNTMEAALGAGIDGFSLESFPRLARLRKKLLDARPALCIERARLFTEYHRREGFDRSKPLMRQANALAYTLDNLPTPLFDDELIAGSTTLHPLGVPLFPEFTAMTIWPELPTLNNREVDPVSIGGREADILANEIFPFWRDLNIHEHVRREGSNPLCLQVFERLVFFINSKSNGISHIIPDYPSVVRRGLLDMAAEAAEFAEKADTAEKAEFFNAVKISLDATVRFAGRYADACDARAAADPAHAGELRETASILRRVPAHPARTLHEALQAVWLTQVALHQENTNAALSFGRLDQFLYPAFEADVSAGRIDARRACELLGAFFLKMGDHTILTPRAAHKLLGGASTDQAITIGGVTRDGSDGVNALTFLILKTVEMLSLREPNVGARWHADTNPEYRRALMRTIYRTGAAPALYNDEEIVTSLAGRGVKLDDARDYGVIGCVETTSAGRTMGMTGAIMFNLAAALELALNNGVHPLSGSQIGPATGPLEDFRSYDDFLNAFRRQLDFMVDLSVDGNNRFAEAHAVLHPTPLLSALVEGTFASGKDVTRGGAAYNSSGVAIVGIADVADSLSAMKRLVFEEKSVSPAELAEALRTDFKRKEKIRALLINMAPKYGTDDPEADATAAALVEMVDDAFSRHPNPRGGAYHIGYWSLTMHAGNFAYVGSLPNGRLKGTSLASGATPVSGAAVKGPTASLNSTAGLPSARIANCMANNHKFSRNMFSQPGKLELFEQLVAGYFKSGGMQIQFNIHNKATLIAARDNPAAHRDLLVRVSGYSAYFCDLNRAMQDEIIARTEDTL